MNDITFYDKNGIPVAYTQDNTHIYTFSGDPVAYFSNNSVYSYGGTHLGRLENGWIRDNDGECVLFTDDATGGPIKPIKSIKPIKGVKEVKPVKPIKSSNWSKLDGWNFFKQ